MRLIPVVDVMRGEVVQARAGDRKNYRPLRSRLIEGCDPLTVSQRLGQHCGTREVYLADLDAIVDARPHHELYADLDAAGLHVFLDSGVRSPAEARVLTQHRGLQIVLGLETLAAPCILGEVTREVSAERLVFSLDLRDGRPIASSSWPESTSEVVRIVVEQGLTRLIVLDLAGVGVDGGVPTLELCRDLRHRHPHLELITGGGVRDGRDLSDLCQAGVDGVLVASALHEGRLTEEDIATYTVSSRPFESPK